MKKLLAIILALMLALSLLTACGGGNAGGNNRNNSEPSQDGNGTNPPASDISAASKGGGEEAFVYGKDYVADKLKGDYSISYKYTVSGEEDSLEITYTRTAAGYYYNYGGMEALFAKNSGGKYDVYTGSAEDGFEKVDLYDPMTQEELEADAMYSIAYSFVGAFMLQYDAYASGMKKDGSGTVAGRNCDKYTFQAAGIGAAVKYSYYIDKDTGICMKWDYDVAAAGQAANMTFECTELKTSGVSLPAYN